MRGKNSLWRAKWTFPDFRLTRKEQAESWSQHGLEDFVTATHVLGRISVQQITSMFLFAHKKTSFLHCRKTCRKAKRCNRCRVDGWCQYFLGAGVLNRSRLLKMGCNRRLDQGRVTYVDQVRSVLDHTWSAGDVIKCALRGRSENISHEMLSAFGWRDEDDGGKLDTWCYLICGSDWCNSFRFTRSFRITALHIAAFKGYEEIVNFLMNTVGIKYDIIDLFGFTANVYAQIQDNQVIVKFDWQNRD